MIEFHKVWIDQCAAARGIREAFGLEKAIGYLIGEKFLNFLEASDGHPEFAAELPRFVAGRLCPPWAARRSGRCRGALGEHRAPCLASARRGPSTSGRLRTLSTSAAMDPDSRRMKRSVRQAR
jgi:hypothetical protein